MVLCLALVVSSAAFADGGAPVSRAVHGDGGYITVTTEYVFFTQYDVHGLHFDNNLYRALYDIYRCGVFSQVRVGISELYMVNCLGPWPAPQQ